MNPVWIYIAEWCHFNSIYFLIIFLLSNQCALKKLYEKNVKARIQLDGLLCSVTFSVTNGANSVEFVIHFVGSFLNSRQIFTDSSYLTPSVLRNFAFMYWIYRNKTWISIVTFIWIWETEFVEDKIKIHIHLQKILFIKPLGANIYLYKIRYL